MESRVRPLSPRAVRPFGYGLVLLRAMPVLSPLADRRDLPLGGVERGNEPDYASSPNLLWLSAMSSVPLPPEVATSSADSAAGPRGSRWSGDGWIVWRAGASGLGSSGALTPVYGASQAGAVVRYALAPGSARRPVAYVRAVHALNGAREGDLAVGIALRPIARVPVTAHAEARAARRGQAVALRPAAFVSAGVDATPVMAGFAARGYAQLGYVAGRDATAFADGSLIVERAFRRDGDSVAAAGLGAWGGAQRDAARFDVGPTASVRLRLGNASARLSADYRYRVAGTAEPASGAALTLSAGF